MILFSFIVLLLPQDAHARVRVVTKGTTSTIRDTDGVIEDESSDINFPINIKNSNCQKRVYAVTVRVSFYSPKGVIPKSTTFSIDGINVVKLSTSNYTPLAYKETFFTYDDNIEDGYLEFDFGNKECPVPVDCDYEVTIKQAVPEIFITNNNYLNQSIRTGKTTSIGIEISDPYVKNHQQIKIQGYFFQQLCSQGTEHHSGFQKTQPFHSYPEGHESRIRKDHFILSKGRSL